MPDANDPAEEAQRLRARLAELEGAPAPGGGKATSKRPKRGSALGWLIAALIVAVGAVIGISYGALRGASYGGILDQPASSPNGPWLPTAADQAAYQKGRDQIGLDMGLCEASRPLLAADLNEGNRYTTYNTATEAKNSCEALSASIDNTKFFSGVSNGDIANQLNEAKHPCSTAIFVFSEAYGIIAKSADQGGEPKPSDVAEAQQDFSDADQWAKECGQKVDAIAKATGLIWPVPSSAPVISAPAAQVVPGADIPVPSASPDQSAASFSSAVATDHGAEPSSQQMYVHCQHDDSACQTFLARVYGEVVRNDDSPAATELGMNEERSNPNAVPFLCSDVPPSAESLVRWYLAEYPEAASEEGQIGGLGSGADTVATNAIDANAPHCRR